MATEYKWRFAHNNYGQESGLDTGDVETFKKDPISSAARETCQNAIDAALEPDNPSMPVKVEYHLFEVEHSKVPGIDGLAAEIRKCYEFKKDSEKESKALKSIDDAINAPTIKCLRISDYNTTGLIGVKKNERSSPFYNLTKGSGVSDKNGTTGGSKGIGKYASFVISTTKAVFYSTRTKDNETGYIGICKLRSRPFEEDDELLTQGIGFYSRDDKNSPILEPISLDASFTRNEDEYGTDIYIIGFDDEDGWKEDIVAKVLDSFMVAIMQGRIEVVVGDIELKKDTVKDLLSNSEFLNSRGKRERKGIIAQYELLSETEGVTKESFDIGDERNAITIYVKQYKSGEEANATKQCVLVRYPYMKIKHSTGYSFLSYSAMCIIHDNILNTKLRAIENPQHIDWEIKRLNTDPAEKRITRQLKKEMDDTISDFIERVLRQSTGESTDMEGAGDYLPSEMEEGESDNANRGPQGEIISTSPFKRVSAPTARSQKIGTDGISNEFAEGGMDGGEAELPRDGDDEPMPNPDNEHRPNDDNPGGTAGNQSVLKRVPLSGMKYKNIVVNKDQGRYDIVFSSAYTEDNCELAIKQFGESTDTYPIEIVSAEINGEAVKVEGGKIVGFSIKEGIKYKVSYKINMSKLFSSEVILNAYR